MSPTTWDPDTINSDPNVTIERDGHTVRQVLHLVEPFQDSSVSSPLDLALRYLHTLASLFGIDPSSLPGTAHPLTAQPPTGIRLDPTPILIAIRGGESTAVIFWQVQRVNLDVNSPTLGDSQVWGAGIRIMVARSPLRVTSVYSTLRRDLPHTVVARGATPFPRTREDAAARLGIDVTTIEGLFVYELPAPPEHGRPPQFAPAIVYRRLDNPQPGAEGPGRRLPYRIVHDGANVIRTQVLASGATGLVFQVDPRSRSARPEPGPYRPGGELDTFRVSVLLPALAPPGPGLDQELRGTRVYVAQVNPLGLNPPTRPPGANFDFYSRTNTNHFAAVSAYYHCDAAFRMVEALGFPLADYFAGNVAARKFPIRVVHRAPIPPGPGVFDGRVVNAQVVAAEAVNAQGPPTPDNYVVEEMRFALGDLSDAIANPIGIAADARFVWHEFGHALLIAATGEPEFRFAHSAGDALAAIICDLDSNVAAGKPLGPWRGVTFPWVEALRRHDRVVEQGWGWQGTLYDPAAYPEMSDPAGYRAEQILSSALFRLYLALGGDAWLGNAPALSVRRAAAAYTVYLIVRAIHQLGPAATTPALDVGALVGALVDSDIATNPYLLPNSTLFPAFQAPRRRGGAVRKVVRWAFERQGLYAPLGVRPWNAPGHPEPVDVYIEDGRHGEYGYTEAWEAAPPDLRLAAIADPTAPDVPPHVLTTSNVFVRVQNRGTDLMPAAATVRVFATRLPTLSPPRWRLAPGSFNLWTELAPTAGAVTAAVVPPLPLGTFVDFGPFEWRPILPGGHHLVACVEAPGDACNALVPTYACAVGPTRLAHLVPFDNNIAYRRVVVQL